MPRRVTEPQQLDRAERADESRPIARRHGELIDIPGMVEAAGINAGLHLVEECIALICGVRDGVLIPRASFFQQKNIRDAIAAGNPQWLVQHEDVLIFQAASTSVSSAEPRYAQRESVLGQPRALGRHSTSRQHKPETGRSSGG